MCLERLLETHFNRFLHRYVIIFCTDAVNNEMLLVFFVICHHSNILFSTTSAAANVENTQWSVDGFPQYSLLTWDGESGGEGRKCVGVGLDLLP